MGSAPVYLMIDCADRGDAGMWSRNIRRQADDPT
jgi:hypothetical protein